MLYIYFIFIHENVSIYGHIKYVFSINAKKINAIFHFLNK